MKLEINSRRKAGNSTNVWKLNSMPLNNQFVKEIKRENETTFGQTNMKTQHTKNYEMQQKQF